MKTVQQNDDPKPGLENPLFCIAKLDVSGTVLSDGDFGVQIKDQVLMHRKVEVYCFKEETSSYDEYEGNYKRT